MWFISKYFDHAFGQIFESIDSCFNIPTCQTELPYIKNSCTLFQTALLLSPCYFMCIHYVELYRAASFMWDNTKARFEMVELIGYTAIVNYIEDLFVFLFLSLIRATSKPTGSRGDRITKQLLRTIFYQIFLIRIRSNTTTHKTTSWCKHFTAVLLMDPLPVFMAF